MMHRRRSDVVSNNGAPWVPGNSSPRPPQRMHDSSPGVLDFNNDTLIPVDFGDDGTGKKGKGAKNRNGGGAEDTSMAVQELHTKLRQRQSMIAASSYNNTAKITDAEKERQSSYMYDTSDTDGGVRAYSMNHVSGGPVNSINRNTRPGRGGGRGGRLSLPEDLPNNNNNTSSSSNPHGRPSRGNLAEPSGRRCSSRSVVAGSIIMGEQNVEDLATGNTMNSPTSHSSGQGVIPPEIMAAYSGGNGGEQPCGRRASSYLANHNNLAVLQIQEEDNNMRRDRRRSDGDANGANVPPEVMAKYSTFNADVVTGDQYQTQVHRRINSQNGGPVFHYSNSGNNNEFATTKLQDASNSGRSLEFAQTNIDITEQKRPSNGSSYSQSTPDLPTIERQARTITDLERKLSEIRRRDDDHFRMLESENKALRRKADRRSSKDQELIERLKRDTSLMKSDIGKLHQDNQRLTSTKAEMQKDIAFLRKDREGLKSKLERTQTKLQKAEIDASNLSTEIAKAKKIKKDEVQMLLKLDRAREETEMIKKDREILELELRRQKNENEELATRFRALEMEYQYHQRQIQRQQVGSLVRGGSVGSGESGTSGRKKSHMVVSSEAGIVKTSKAPVLGRSKTKK